MNHLTRSSRNGDHKMLVLTDSRVALGALAKSRSSAPPLLRLCRRWAFSHIVLGMRPCLRDVPIGNNHADGPSRQARIGDHP